MYAYKKGLTRVDQSGCVYPRPDIKIARLEGWRIFQCTTGQVSSATYYRQFSSNDEAKKYAASDVVFSSKPPSLQGILEVMYQFSFGLNEEPNRWPYDFHGYPFYSREIKNKLK